MKDNPVTPATGLLNSRRKEVTNMPGGDRTGPLGYGSMSGRRMGYCTGNPGPGSWYSGPGFGYGRGRGLGFGRGMGWRCFGRERFPMHFVPAYAPWEEPKMTPEQETDCLKRDSRYLKEELTRIEKRIRELEGEKK